MTETLRNNGSETDQYSPPIARQSNGTFGPGNPGRPRGSRNRTSLAVEAFLHGEAEALTRKAVEMALNGDATAMRLCLERIAPPRKDTPVTFALPPMTSAGDAVKAAGAILAAVTEGDLTPTEGAQVMALVETFRRTLELADMEDRVTELERAVRGST